MQNGRKALAPSRLWRRRRKCTAPVFRPRKWKPRGSVRETTMSTQSRISGTSQTPPLTGSTAATPGLLKESLAAQLREAILGGKLSPGEKIIERRWAREFGAAQVSVREALNILIAEGFATKGHGRSARVLRLTDAAIIHTYQVRGALEGLAARIIVEQHLAIADLEAAMLELRRAVETNDVRSVIDRVQRFHVCLLEKPGNPFLRENGLRLIIPLYAFTLMRALAKGLDASPWAQQIANHQRIVEAIRMGNPQLAEQVVIHVTNRFMERYLEVWGQ
jgi:DNA-binding GntR family transcriptional regulator